MDPYLQAFIITSLVTSCLSTAAAAITWWEARQTREWFAKLVEEAKAQRIR